MSDTSGNGTPHSKLDLLGAVNSVLIFVIAILTAIIGALKGEWILLGVPLIAWPIVAMDPVIGKWGAQSND